MNFMKFLGLGLLITGFAFSQEGEEGNLTIDNQFVLKNKNNDVIGIKVAPYLSLPGKSYWSVNIMPFIWQSEIDGAEFIADTKSFENSPVLVDQVITNTPFSWDFGFKAGVKYTFDFDAWDLYFSTLYFKNKSDVSKKAKGLSGLVPIDLVNLNLTAFSEYAISQGLTSDAATKANSQIKVFYNTYSLDLGKSFSLSNSFSARSYAGIQATWLKINDFVSLTGGGVYVDDVGDGLSVQGLGDYYLNSTKTTDFIGAGIKLGLDTYYKIGGGFGFFANGSTALLNGYFKRTVNSTYTFYPDNLIYNVARFHRFIPTFNSRLGLCYSHLFSNNTQEFTVSLAYEATYLLNAVYIKLGRMATSLGMQGVDLNLGWSF